MFLLVFLTVNVLPLIGLMRMEGGAYGADVGEFGYANGATIAYAAHLTAMFAGFAMTLAIGRVAIYRSPRPRRPMRAPDFRRLARATLVVHVVTLLFLYYVAGAWRVVAGIVEKGEFRSTLGAVGPFAYFVRDFLTPMAGAVAAFVYRSTPRRAGDHLLMAANLLLVALNAAVWGYRAAVLFLLIPAFVFLVPRLSVRRIVVLLVGAVLLASSFSMFYEGRSLDVAVKAVTDRATIGTGNSAWKIWDIYRFASEPFPPYAPTLLSVLGGRGAAMFGITTVGSMDLNRIYDYSALMTLVVKRFYWTLNTARSSVTGTVFAEGVIALGSPGFLLFSGLAGIVTGLAKLAIERASMRQQPAVAALAATYFGTSVLGWLNSGGVTILVLLPFFVYYGLAFAICRELVGRASRRPRRRVVPALLQSDDEPLDSASRVSDPGLSPG